MFRFEVGLRPRSFGLGLGEVKDTLVMNSISLLAQPMQWKQA